ncbi:TPR end-of-group domain-containing protein [Ramlibacter sp. PS4R-6]|uniref:TPR end-of-group domain-containing protein n=1 Tax=Ramlibacter sp. PS4R-6 TaxID=3133438 RepID=UPI0030AE8CC1
MIRLQLLGGVDARRADGTRIDALLAQPRRLALLAFLAIESERGACSRERLLATFWPDKAPAQASANLRQALAFLRRELGEATVEGVGQHALRVAPAHLACDAVERLAQVRDAPSAPSPGEFLAALNLQNVGEDWETWLAAMRLRLAGEAGSGDDLPGPGGAAASTPGDPAARAAYLRGRFHWNRRPRESLKALTCLEEAVQLAPDFAPGHAALADVYNTLGSWESGALASGEAFPKAQAAAQRALQLDPCCAAAHTSLAYATAHHGWDWRAASAQFTRALELDPAYAHAHHWHAHLLVAQRRWQEGLAAGQRALALQPDDVIINVHMAWHHWLARDAAAAIEQADRTEHLDDTDQWPPFFRGMACVMCGRGDQAVDELRSAAQRSRGNAVMRAGLGYVYAATGDKRAARAVLREFSEAADTQQRYAYEAAVILAALGEADAAFAALEAAWRTRSGWMAYLAVDPRWDPVRGDARFAALVARLGLD